MTTTTRKIRPMTKSESEKDIVDIRRERDDLAIIVRVFIRATRHDIATLRVRDRATSYLKREGLEGSPLR